MNKIGVDMLTEVKVCLHCGNKTQMELRSEYLHEIGEYDYEPGHGHYQIGAFFEKYNLFECPVCNGFTLECKYWDTFALEYNGEPITETKILYPAIDTSLKKLPNGVSAAYQAAKKVRYIDGAICAIAIRRTLEKMCKDKGASGKDLYKKLKNLSENGVIPPILDELSLLIKDIGNEAAHADEADFDDHLIKSLLRFTEMILEYVYVLPDETKRLQREMSLRKEELTESKTKAQ